MTDAKAILLAGVGPEFRDVLERIPLDHLFATAADIAVSDAPADVLAAFVELFAASTAAARRRADLAEAQLAAVRRSHLALVPEPLHAKEHL